MPSKLEEKFYEIRDEKNPGKLNEIIVWDGMGTGGFRALMDALRAQPYEHVRIMRFWKAESEDEGVRAICQFLRVSLWTHTLELIECNISSLGCQFLGQILSSEFNHPLQVLKLDHNPIGYHGVMNLSQGLNLNTTLQVLSLTYCGITSEGARPILEILIFQRSNLKELELQGNALMPTGISQIFHALTINNSLIKLNVADNQFGEEPIVLRKLESMLKQNNFLQILDLRLNGIFETGALLIKNLLKPNEDGSKENYTLNVLYLPDGHVRDDIIEELSKLLNTNKSRGRAAKKKKGGKKKK